MAQSMLLCFNMTGDRRLKLNLACMKNKIRIVNVDPGDYGCTLGALCGFMPKEAPEEGSFTDEMVVFVNFAPATVNAFLQTWKQLGQKPIQLKAVVTPTNVRWSAIRLHKEIAQEHQAMHSKTTPIHTPEA